MSNQPPVKPDDDDAYTIDTRIGGRRPPHRTPPVQSAKAPDRPVYTTDPEWRDGIVDAPAGRAPGAQPAPDADHTRVMPARPATGAGDGPPGRTPPREVVYGSEPPAGPRGPRTPRRRRPRARRIIALVLLIPLLLTLGYGAWMYTAANSAWGQVQRTDATPDGERPAGGKGQNFLLVGSDSRNLTAEQRKNLKVADKGDKDRADTMILIHLPEDGKPVLVSIPRDSYVEIPGHQGNKINASYSLGGPELLVETVEKNTGLRVDGYMEIGFGGFAEIVDSVGGVRICVKEPMKDKDAKLNVKAGCQQMDGPTALGYVRARKCDTCGNDFGRMERQRQFLAALVKQTATKENMFLPWRMERVGGSVMHTLTVGDDDSMWQTYKLLQALRGASGGNSVMIQVPNNGGGHYVRGMDTVLWDEKLAPQLWRALKEDTALPAQVTKTAG